MRKSLKVRSEIRTESRKVVPYENKKEYEELYKQAVLGIEEIRDNI